MPLANPALVAGGDIRPCRFVKFDTSADFTGLEANANERTIGISGRGTRSAPLNDINPTALHASAGEAVQLFGEGEETLLELAGSVTAGARLKPDTDGKGVAAATTGATEQNVGAIALEDGASGGLIRVQVKQESYYPALS